MTMKSDNTYHVMPVGENHTCVGITCWCVPVSQTVFRHGDIVGYVVVHNSKDGREYIERGEIQ